VNVHQGLGVVPSSHRRQQQRCVGAAPLQALPAKARSSQASNRPAQGATPLRDQCGAQVEVKCRLWPHELWPPPTFAGLLRIGNDGFWPGETTQSWCRSPSTRGRSLAACPTSELAKRRHRTQPVITAFECVDQGPLGPPPIRGSCIGATQLENLRDGLRRPGAALE